MVQRPRAPHSSRLGRRAALEGAAAVGVLGAAASAGVTPSRARADRAAEREAANVPGATEVRERTLRAHDLRPLTGEALAALRACQSAGVRLLEAFEPRHGGLPFVVEIVGGHHAGGRRAFELLRLDTQGDAPLAGVGTLALVMENRGDGTTPTSEDDARLARRLASALEPHRAALEVLPLLTARERRRRAPFATLHVPLDPASRG